MLLGSIALFFFRERLPPAFRGIDLPVAYDLLGVLLRVLTIFGHMFLTLLVWRGVSQGRPSDLLRPIAAYIVIDVVGFGCLIWLSGASSPLLALCPDLVAGALWMARRFRSQVRRAAGGRQPSNTVSRSGAEEQVEGFRGGLRPPRASWIETRCSRRGCSACRGPGPAYPRAEG